MNFVHYVKFVSLYLLMVVLELGMNHILNLLARPEALLKFFNLDKIQVVIVVE
jgi:hypothetical protein